MHGPPLVAWLLVALSTAAAISCLARREARHEALMGIGMAVMAVPLTVLGPQRWIAPAFAAGYAVAATRALLPGRGGGHRLHHAVCAGAMVYMAAAMAGSGGPHAGHDHHAGAGVPVLTGVLLLYFAAYVLRAGTRLVVMPAHAGLPAAGPGPVLLRHAPEVAAACRVAMALAMLAMLLLL